MKNILILTLILIFFNLSFLSAEKIPIYKFSKRKINVNGRDLRVLIAKTEKEREVGLSNTDLSTLDRLGVDGMLFIFDEPSEKTFQAWHMKYDLMLLILEKKGENIYYVKERKPLRIGTIEKVNGKYILEIPLKNSLIGAK